MLLFYSPRNKYASDLILFSAQPESPAAHWFLILHRDWMFCKYPSISELNTSVCAYVLKPQRGSQQVFVSRGYDVWADWGYLCRESKKRFMFLTSHPVLWLRYILVFVDSWSPLKTRDRCYTQQYKRQSEPVQGNDLFWIFGYKIKHTGLNLLRGYSCCKHLTW